MKEIVGLNLLWFAIVCFITFVFCDEDWKTKLKLIAGSELCLLLMSAGIYFLYL